MEAQLQKLESIHKEHIKQGQEYAPITSQVNNNLSLAQAIDEFEATNPESNRYDNNNETAAREQRSAKPQNQHGSSGNRGLAARSQPESACGATRQRATAIIHIRQAHQDGNARRNNNKRQPLANKSETSRGTNQKQQAAAIRKNKGQQ